MQRSCAATNEGRDLLASDGHRRRHAVTRQSRHELEHLAARTQKLGVAILLHLNEADRMDATVVEHGGGQRAAKNRARVNIGAVLALIGQSAAMRR